MATTTNFGWETPDDTDLVKDGAAAMRTLGNAIDTSLVDLKGGTTGQILSKASNTDLDYTWITNDVGDITGVTAGTGISGGGTSGNVTITNSMATAIDAKGDLIVGTGADTFSRLAIGTNNYVLTADSAEATGMKWAAAAAGGKVLQVVYGSNDTNGLSTSTTYADTGLTASITPSSTSSKVLVIVTQAGCYKNNSDTSLFLQLLRGTTSLIEFERNAGQTASTAYNFIGTCSTTYLDSPATTSSTTYKTQFRNKSAGGNGSGVNAESGGINSKSTIMLLEIGA